MRTTVVLAIVLGSSFAVLAVTRSSKPAVASKAPVASPAEPMLTLAKPEPRRAMPDAYETWRAAHEENGGDKNVDVVLRWHKALSSQTTAARGMAHLDLIEGSVSVELEGLKELGAVDVWFVDNVEGPGRSVKPEPGDRFLYVGFYGSGAPRKVVLCHFGRSSA